MPVRIQRQRTKGWRMPANTVYVGRPTKWGNPYRVELFGGDRAMVVELFRKFAAFNNDGGATLRKNALELRGKHLACWCPLDQPCHADVLLELANV
jgi:hypothetical protein